MRDFGPCAWTFLDLIVCMLLHNAAKEGGSLHCVFVHECLHSSAGKNNHMMSHWHPKHPRPPPAYIPMQKSLTVRNDDDLKSQRPS